MAIRAVQHAAAHGDRILQRRARHQRRGHVPVSRKASRLAGGPVVWCLTHNSTTARGAGNPARGRLFQAGWTRSKGCLIFALVLIACGCSRSPEARPMSPRESLKAMRLSEDFRVELFAAEPDVV